MAAREAAEPSADHEGLSGAFHEKVISLDTMEPRLLLPTAVAIALVVACAVLVATRGLPWPLVAAGRVSGDTLATVPLPVAVLATITVIIAWSFILSGALHAHLVARVAGVGAYAFVGLWTARLEASRPRAAVIALIVLSVVAAAAGLYVTDRGNHHQAPHLHHRVRLRLPTFGWVLLATALIYGVLASNTLGGGGLVTWISFQLQFLEFVLIPVLVLAGTDFAEWAEVVSGRLSSLLERLPRAALSGGLAATAVGILTWAYLTQGVTLEFALEATIPELIFLVGVAGVGLLSLRRPISTRVPFWALALGAVLVVGGLTAASGISVYLENRAQGATIPAGVPLVAVSHRTAPTFRILVPDTWSESPVPGGWMWSGPLEGRPGRLVVVNGPLDSERALSAALATPARVGARSPAAGGWSSSPVTATVMGAAAAGEVWTRGSGDHVWVLAGVTVGGRTPASDKFFDTIQASWTANPEGNQESAIALQRQALLFTVICSGVSALVLLVLGLVLLLRGGGEVATAGLFLMLCGLFIASGFTVAGLGAALLGLNPSTHAVGLANLLFTLALASLILVALTAIPPLRLPKPVLRLLLVLFLGLIGLLVLVSVVFSAAQSGAERFSVVGGVVLVAAMLWDVLMSGESFTNSGGLAAPRHTRVLIYLGYTLMVVTAVVFFASLQVQGGGSGGVEFDSEIWPQSGITNLGPPLLLTFFFVNLSAWRRRRPMGRPDGLDQVDRSVLDEVAG